MCGAYAFKSSDGNHWLFLQEAPIITDGKFDTQNLAFRDTIRGEYRAPHIFIGFPSRYIEPAWGPAVEALPDQENRRLRFTASPRCGKKGAAWPRLQETPSVCALS